MISTWKNAHGKLIGDGAGEDRGEEEKLLADGGREGG
jgi:hypothetical protein